jgi:hypothetical protein
LDFTLTIQRKEVWDIEHKSNLIAAMLVGVPIENLLFEEDGESGYLVLDGLQRSSTILQYLNDSFAIAATCKIADVNGEDIVGKKFSELSVTLQETLKEFELSISLLRPLTEEEREMVFFMRNQAVPLSKVQLLKVFLGSQTLADLNALLTHPLMQKLGLSNTKSENDLQVVIECMMLESESKLSFSGNDLSVFSRGLRASGSNETQLETLVQVFDYMDTAIAPKAPTYKIRKMHIPILYLVAKKAKEADITEDMFFCWVQEFFKNNKGDGEFAQLCSSGVLKRANIDARISFMVDAYTNFMRGERE